MRHNKKSRLNRPADGFTLMELLIAISISSFVALAMISMLQNVQKIITRSRRSLVVNKYICLIFNQIERDFNTALIPTIAKEEKVDKKGEKKDGEKKQPDNKTEEEEKKSKQKDKNKSKDKKDGKEKDGEQEGPLFFVSEIDEEIEEIKIGEKKYKPLKRVSFVNTNPLQIWGQNRTRFVRVLYELVKNKEKSKKGEIIYDLYRKETLDLKNEKFKEQEEETFKSPSRKTKGEDMQEIRSHIIATDVKGIYIEYVMHKPKPEDEKEKEGKKQKSKAVFDLEPGEDEYLYSATWGDKDETKNIVPQQIELHVILLTKKTGQTPPTERQFEERTYSCIIPIMS